MVTITRRAFIYGSVLLFSLLVCPIIIFTVGGQDNGSMQIAPSHDLNITNHSISTIGKTGDFAPGPTPITIFRVKLNQSTLPGPRDMGCGPKRH